MGKVARTRNTKVAVCPGSGQEAADIDAVLIVGRCLTCNLRLRLIDPNRKPSGEPESTQWRLFQLPPPVLADLVAMRHVAPPLLVNQAWSVAEGRHV